MTDTVCEVFHIDYPMYRCSIEGPHEKHVFVRPSGVTKIGNSDQYEHKAGDQNLRKRKPCRTPDKKAFSSNSEALNGMIMTFKDGLTGSGRTYLCECGAYHITKKVKIDEKPLTSRNYDKPRENCSSPYKIRYETESEAWEVAGGTSIHYMKEGSRVPYPCKCKGYHVGVIKLDKDGALAFSGVLGANCPTRYKKKFLNKELAAIAVEKIYKTSTTGVGRYYKCSCSLYHISKKPNSTTAKVPKSEEVCPTPFNFGYETFEEAVQKAWAYYKTSRTGKGSAYLCECGKFHISEKVEHCPLKLEKFLTKQEAINARKDENDEVFMCECFYYHILPFERDCFLASKKGKQKYSSYEEALGTAKEKYRYEETGKGSAYLCECGFYHISEEREQGYCSVADDERFETFGRALREARKKYKHFGHGFGSARLCEDCHYFHMVAGRLEKPCPLDYKAKKYATYQDAHRGAVQKYKDEEVFILLCQCNSYHVSKHEGSPLCPEPYRVRHETFVGAYLEAIDKYDTLNTKKGETFRCVCKGFHVRPRKVQNDHINKMKEKLRKAGLYPENPAM